MIKFLTEWLEAAFQPKVDETIPPQQVMLMKLPPTPESDPNRHVERSVDNLPNDYVRVLDFLLFWKQQYDERNPNQKYWPVDYPCVRDLRHTTGWSKNKVSNVLHDMDDDGLIYKAGLAFSYSHQDTAIGLQKANHIVRENILKYRDSRGL